MEGGVHGERGGFKRGAVFEWEKGRGPLGNAGKTGVVRGMGWNRRVLGRGPCVPMHTAAKAGKGQRKGWGREKSA